MVFTCFILVMLSAFEEQAIPPVDVVVEALPGQETVLVVVVVSFDAPRIAPDKVEYH